MAFLEKQAQIRIAGSYMHVVEAGKGDAVLLGHSYLWDALMWRPQIEALSRQYRVIAPALWGHGGSGPMPAATDDLRALARHHLALMDVLGLDRFTIVGLSVGGMWGAELALLTPERVRPRAARHLSRRRGGAGARALLRAPVRGRGGRGDPGRRARCDRALVILARRGHAVVSPRRQLPRAARRLGP